VKNLNPKMSWKVNNSSSRSVKPALKPATWNETNSETNIENSQSNIETNIEINCPAVGHYTHFGSFFALILFLWKI
jgi:hypothetical protein